MKDKNEFKEEKVVGWQETVWCAVPLLPGKEKGAEEQGVRVASSS